MADTRKIVKVFLASPGDLSDERKATKSVVDELNDLLAEEFGYQVELVGWEDTVSVYGRPQATINKELARCELFIGMVWQRWGTPPDEGGPYSSGFEEEFWTSVERHEKEGHPQISMFFKNIESNVLRDPGEQLKKVLAFRQRLIDEKKILFENFSEVRDLEKKLRRCITSYIRKLRAEEIEQTSESFQGPASITEDQTPAQAPDSESNTPFSGEGSKFLRELISKTERSGEREPISPVEVARLRLLSTIVRGQGNDEAYLGVHDANILFRAKPQLGQSELTGLMDSALSHYTNENVPLWYWYLMQGGFDKNNISIFALFGTTEERVGALKAMTLISEPLPTNGHLTREKFLSLWLDKDSPSTVRVAFLKYLRNCGLESDLSDIRQEFERGDSQTVNLAAEAMICISNRNSRESALKVLCELQPSFVDRTVLDELFRNPDALTTDGLFAGIGHRSPEVRQRVASALRQRRSLPETVAKNLLKDSSPSVRYVALQTLMDEGQKFSDSDAKQILTKSQVKGLQSAAGLISSDGEEWWEKYQDDRLRSLSDAELQEEIAKEWIIDARAMFVMAERHFKKFSTELRTSIDDQFKATFAKGIDRIVLETGDQNDLSGRLRALEDFSRRRLTRRALEVICTKGDATDLRRIREVLKTEGVEVSLAAIEYLRKHGEWDDIPLLAKLIQRPKRGTTLLGSITSSADYSVAAKAIFTIGKSRMAEVLAMQLPSQLRCRLIALMGNKDFPRLPEVTITQLLDAETDTVRKAAALKCVLTMSKTKLKVLLDNYISGDKQRYYNVVHWLDFGVSAPKDLVSAGAGKELSDEWLS